MKCRLQAKRKRYKLVRNLVYDQRGSSNGARKPERVSRKFAMAFEHVPEDKSDCGNHDYNVNELAQGE